MGLWAPGVPGLELGLRCLCVAEPLVCAGDGGTCGRAQGLLPAGSEPRLPLEHGQQLAPGLARCRGCSSSFDWCSG